MAVLIQPNDKGGYLAGQLLIATPALADGCFDRSVVYLCEHTAAGAMGVVVNHPIANIHLKEILQALSLPAPTPVADLPVYFGGPVEAHRGFVLHSSDKTFDDSVVGADGIALTANVAMLKGIAEGAGPRKAFLVLGYAGWGAGQLEKELEQGSWISAPATSELVFGTDDELKWTAAAGTLGVNLAHLSSMVGHA